MAEWKPRVQKLGSGEQEHLLFINSLVKENRLDEAEAELQKIFASNKRSFEATLTMGRIHYKKKEYDKAATYFDQAAKLDPSQVQAPLRAGLTFLRMSNRKENVGQAEAAFRRAVELDPKNVRGRVGLAQVCYMKEELPEAMTHVREALRSDPGLVQARLLYARIQNKIGRTDSAIQELETVASMRPDQPNVAIQTARLLLQKGETDKAEASLLSAIDGRADDPAVWDFLGRIRLKKGDNEGAIEAFREVVRLNRKSVSAHLRLLDALIAERRTEEARTVMDELPRKRRIESIIQKYQGDIFRAERRFKEATEFYRASLLKSPGGEEVVATIEKTVAGDEEPDYEVLAARYEPAIAKMVEETKESRRQARKEK